MNANLPVVYCLANLDSVIEKKIENSSLAAGPIAMYADGQIISVLGRWRSKGVWGSMAVRWICPGRSGMFGKGLSLYGLNHLVEKSNLAEVK